VVEDDVEDAESRLDGEGKDGKGGENGVRVAAEDRGDEGDEKEIAELVGSLAETQPEGHEDKDVKIVGILIRAVKKVIDRYGVSKSHTDRAES
jgi:hypothetical protein